MRCSEWKSLPQQAPWWREGVALQVGEGMTQEDGQQRGGAPAQAVAGNDQFVLLETQRHNTKHTATAAVIITTTGHMSQPTLRVVRYGKRKSRNGLQLGAV